MSQIYTGKVVVITGANSGIGETAAILFQQAGATVYGVARRPEALDEARAKHPNIHWVLADVTKREQMFSAMESIATEAGRIDVLVNNAAVFFPGPVEQITEEMVRGQFEVNVFGTTYATQAALPALKKSRGSVVNISSAAGHKAAAGAAHYGATKAAVESLTRSWALELAPQGVRVNAVAPGPTETPVFAKVGLDADSTEAMKRAFVSTVPLGRIARTEEEARWIVGIADPQVTWMTGNILAIDGGVSLT